MRKELALLGVLLVLAGCSEDPTGPQVAEGGPDLATCEYADACGGGGGGGGGGEEEPPPPPPSDPNSLAPGLWINGVNPTRCFSPTGAGINDLDHDRMDDWCEGSLAQNFRPEMSFNPYDCDTRRDPYFAVKYFPTHANTVRITYMLAYYVDCGTSSGLGCPGMGYCSGHEGDSEFIQVDLRFEPISQHWYVKEYTLSAHYGEITSHTERTTVCYGSSAYAACDSGDEDAVTNWPAKFGGHFRVFVAKGKHGSYRTRNQCNTAAVWYDDCTSNPSPGVRLFLAGTHNVGSRSVNLPNSMSCVQTGGAIGRESTECLWATTGSFAGWSGINSGVMPYGQLLTTLHDCYKWRVMLDLNNNVVTWCEGGY